MNGVHPRHLLAQEGGGQFIDRMVASLLRITSAFAPRPVIYRAIDFRTNEFRNLTGGSRFEPLENNPMIGYRGCYRYVREPQRFGLELEVLARVREQTADLHLMIPFVRTRWELQACLRAIDASPLGRQRGLHRWVMAEVPAATNHTNHSEVRIMSQVPDELTVRAAVSLATRAPSIHNSQPWRWRLADSSVHLLAGTSRLLPVTDPDGRDLLLSCGAALHHLRVALAAEGWAPLPATPRRALAEVFERFSPADATAGGIEHRRAEW